MEQKTLWIKIGDFFFKYRNKIFPVILAALLLGFAPANDYSGHGDQAMAADYIAIALVVLGLGLRAAVIGFAYIKRGGLNKKVYADDLVTTGFFGVCRNPLYVGNMLLYAGIFMMHGNPYVAIGGTLGYFLIYQSIIAAEEYFLRGKFGDAYASYCQDVPRWGFRPSLLKQATDGMRFNLKRVIVKDYPTIANAVIALIAIKTAEAWRYQDTEIFRRALIENGAVIVAIALVAAAISLAKKHKKITL